MLEYCSIISFVRRKNSLFEAALGLVAGGVSDSEHNMRNDSHIH